MLKNQRQNLIMENEFHIKEERVKAQQSNAKTHDKDAARSADSTSKEEKSSTPATTPKAKTVKSEGTESKSTTATTTTKEAGKVSATPSAKSKLPLQEGASVKKEGSATSSSSSASTAEPGAKKNGDKALKEKSSGKGKREEATAVPCWDVAPTDPASSTSQPVSGTSTPSSSKRGSPPTQNGPAVGSPKTGQRRQGSPEPAPEKGMLRTSTFDGVWGLGVEVP